VDAKPEAVPFYERHGFVPLEGVVEGASQADPTPMFLAIDTVVSALDAWRRSPLSPEGALARALRRNLLSRET